MSYYTYSMTKVNLILMSMFFSFSALAQKEKAIISLPESHMIYVGFDNLVKISFNKKRVRKISLECNSCELLKPLNNEKNEWVIRVSKIEPISIFVKNRRGKEIGYKRFVVLPPPKPLVSLDTTNAQTIIKKIPNKITLKLPSTIPLNANYQVIQWTAEVDGQIFEGRGGSINKEMANYIEKTKTGIMIFKINYRGVFEESEIKEIFQYSLE